MLRYKTLEDRGIKLNVVGDKLRLSPKQKITPEILQFVRAHKQEIMAELKLSVIYHNPYPQGTPEARKESLMQCMDATWQEVHKSVQEAYEGKQTQFKATSNILLIEQRIEALQRDILKGKAKLADFSLAAYEWERSAKAELN